MTGRKLLADGQEWQDMRAGRLVLIPSVPLELQNIIRQMKNANGKLRPTTAELLAKRQLLSDNGKKLITERNKDREVSQAFEARLKKITPPEKLLFRSNTFPRGL